MDFSLVRLDEAQQAFRAEVRAFLSQHVTPHVLEEERLTGSGFSEPVHLALGQRGWIMPRWPAERGGAGLDAVQARILEVEMEQARVPIVTLSTTQLVVPAIEKHASPGLAAELLPAVVAGTVRFCLGYTEPDGGSDIAAARTRAVRAGNDWVINGAKIFTTGAQNCQYAFLIARTDPGRPKHGGLTMFLAPLDAAGVEIQPIRTFGNERTNVVYFGDVRVPDRYRIGDVNDGWAVLRGPLDEEHGVLPDSADRPLRETSQGATAAHMLERALDAAAAWAVTARRDGTRPADDPLVVYRLGEIEMEIRAALCTPDPMGRVFGSEVLIRGAAALIDLVGPEALVSEGVLGALGGGRLDFTHRYAQGTATYGGTVEVFRNIIAQHVLGLPRPFYPGSRILDRNGGHRIHREGEGALAST